MFANISRTRPACSFAALLLSGTVKPIWMEVWLRYACKRFAITWDWHGSQVCLVVLLLAVDWRFLPLPQTANVPQVLFLPFEHHQLQRRREQRREKAALPLAECQFAIRRVTLLVDHPPRPDDMYRRLAIHQACSLASTVG